MKDKIITALITLNTLATLTVLWIVIDMGDNLITLNTLIIRAVWG